MPHIRAPASSSLELFDRLREACDSLAIAGVRIVEARGIF
jgi:hypothetical protein